MNIFFCINLVAALFFLVGNWPTIVVVNGEAKIGCGGGQTKQSFLMAIYMRELAKDDGTGGNISRNFVCELEQQTLPLIEEAFPPSPPAVAAHKFNLPSDEETQSFSAAQHHKANALEGKVAPNELLTENSQISNEAKLLRQMFEIVAQMDPPLARIYTLLTESLYKIKDGSTPDGSTILGTLRKQVIHASLLLADRLNIPLDQIVPSSEIRRQKMGAELLTELAILLGGKMKWNSSSIKSNLNENCAADDAANAIDDNRQKEQQILKLILSVVDEDGTNTAAAAAAAAGVAIVKGNNANDDGSPTRRQRRRRRFIEYTAMRGAIVVVAIVIMLGILSYIIERFMCRKPPASQSNA